MAAAAETITEVDFVGMPTRDLEAAVAFYGQTLGLRRSVYLRSATLRSSRRAT